MRGGAMRRARTLMVLAILLVVGCAPQIETVLPTLMPSPLPTPTTVLTVSTAPVAVTTETSTPLSTATPQPTSTEEVKSVTFTIVYDNNDYDERLRTAWGFACLVETGEATILFDTGGDGPTLLGNMDTLGLDPLEIDAIVLSHAHGDHTGGLAGLLDTGARPTVYVPAAFPASFKNEVRSHTELVEVSGPMEILPRMLFIRSVHTTGEMGASIVEQALVVETEAGLVVVTGCAHPGVEKLARRAKESVGGEIYLVMGGFHLSSASRQRIESIIADFRELGVQRVAPCHCTGDQARQMFSDAFGKDYIPAGVGRVIIIGAGEVE